MIPANDERLLSELIDGRPVDPDRLACILTTPGGRESLVGFARLRAELAAEVAMPRAAFARRVERELGASGRGRPGGRAVVAIAGLLVGVALGVLVRPLPVDTVAARPAGEEQSPPDAARVLRFEPGTEWRRSDS